MADRTVKVSLTAQVTGYLAGMDKAAKATAAAGTDAEKARLDDIDRYKAEFPKDSPPNLNGAFWTVEKHGELAASEPQPNTE